MTTMVNTPECFIVGPPKCMTTSIVQTLLAATNADAPKKEPFFYSRAKAFDLGGEAHGPSMSGNWERGSGWYEAVYRDVADDEVSIDGSTLYFADPDSARLIRQATNNPRVLIILRHPVRRLFSQYQHELSLGYKIDIPESTPWTGRFLYYLNTSLYSTHLARFLDTFGPDAVEIAIMEEILADPQPFLLRLIDFFGLELLDARSLQLRRANARKRIRLRRLQRVRRSVQRSGALERIPAALDPLRRSVGRATRWLVFNRVEPDPVSVSIPNVVASQLEEDRARVEALLERSLEPIWTTEPYATE